MTEAVWTIFGVGITTFVGGVGALVAITRKNGNGKIPRHCLDHQKMVESVARVETHVVWIRKKMENGHGEDLT